MQCVPVVLGLASEPLNALYSFGLFLADAAALKPSTRRGETRTACWCVHRDTCHEEVGTRPYGGRQILLCPTSPSGTPLLGRV